MGLLFSELLGDSRDFSERLRTSKPDGLPSGSTAARICSPRICCLWIKRIAELSQAERSEASPREARLRAKRGTVRRAKRDPPPPQAPAPTAEGARRRKAPGAVRRPRASRGPPRKARMRLNCHDSAAAYKQGLNFSGFVGTARSGSVRVKWTFWAPAIPSHIRSRSTPVVPNA